MLFIGTETEIKEIPLDKEKPDFYIERIMDEFEPVRKVFKSPNVYYVGTSQGCGCGFNTLYTPRIPDLKVIQNRSLKFSKYLAMILGKSKQWEEKRENDSHKRLLDRDCFIRQINKLLDVVESQIIQGQKVEMYTCWAGDYDSLPEYHKNIDFELSYVRENFHVQERELIIFN